MKEKVINGYQVAIISKEEMADFISRALNNPKVQDACVRATDFVNLAHLIQSYGVATGDLSDTMIEKMAERFSDNKATLEYRAAKRTELSDRAAYFHDVMLEDMINHHAKRLGIEDPTSIENKKRILSSIYMQANSNLFFTHSFPGALIDMVEKEGLDASKELFNSQYALLQKAGMAQPFKIGKVCYCELSHATFGYAMNGSPERLNMAICAPGRYCKIDETNADHLKARLEIAVDNNPNVNSSTARILKYAAKQIIDFYDNEETSCIAIMSDVHEPSLRDEKLYENKFAMGFQERYFDAKMMLKRTGDAEMFDRLEAVYQEAKKGIFGDESLSFIADFNKKYPENKVFNNFESVVTTDIITSFCMRHFLRNGNADGYEADFIPRSDFALAVIPKAHDFYAERHRTAVTAITEDLIMDCYQTERYQSVYCEDIKRGIDPSVSFEEFKKLNPVLKTDKDYIAWRVDQKSRMPREEWYLSFREKARGIYEKSLRQKPVLAQSSKKELGR